MTQRFGTATWSLVVPPGWEAWHDPECATLTDEHEIGALQVSAAFKDSDVTDEDLRDFAAKHLEAGASPIDVECGDFRGIELAFADEEFSWRQWYLRNGAQMLFVTYSCEPADAWQHVDVVDAAVTSLRATSA